ncbi:TfoX/Sxy family protein [Xanthobacteraceae bacterium A53D]
MDKDAIAEQFAAVGPVEVKRMFGGHGVFRDGLMFVLEIRGDLFVKADAAFAEELEGMGARRLGYEAKGRRVDLPYWTLPDVALDDEDLRDSLFRRSIAVARSLKAAPAKTRKPAARTASAPPPDLDELGVGGGSKGSGAKPAPARPKRRARQAN